MTTPEVDLSKLDPKDVERFKLFFGSLTARRQPTPETLWHYTSGAGLVSIVRSGMLYATQISCLNDSKEYVHLAGIVAAEIAERRRVTADAGLRQLYEHLASNLTTATDVAAANVFVACLSNARDDLGQWRGYGAGECGFAIELITEDVLTALEARGGPSPLLRVEYEEEEQRALARVLLDNVADLFKQGPQRPEYEPLWTTVLGQGYSDLAMIMHAKVKHPSFRAEQEYRIFTRLLPDEHARMEFTGKRTLLSRHVPVRLGERLPIRSIMVGPSGNQASSRLSAGALLKKYGYGEPPIHLSGVPYREV